MGTGSAGDRLLQSRRFFDFAPVGIAVVGAAGREHGRILDANPAFADLVRVAPGSLTGTAICELLHAEERALGAEQLTRLIAGTTPQLEGNMRMIRADGEIGWVRVNACLLHDQAGRAEAVLMHVSDLTGLRQAATRQEEVTRRLSEAQELARIGSFEWLPETDSVLISDEVFRLFGLRPGSLPATLSAWEPLLDRADLPTLMDAVTAALAAGAPQSSEFRFKTASGAMRWAEGRVTAERDGTRVSRLRGTIQDIHVRKLGEDKLRHEVQELAEVGAAARCDLRGPAAPLQPGDRGGWNRRQRDA
jgi:two-component system, sensor histidine kinase and response regulator